MGIVRMPDQTLLRMTGASGPEIYRGDRLPKDPLPSRREHLLNLVTSCLPGRSGGDVDLALVNDRSRSMTAVVQRRQRRPLHASSD